MQDRPPAEQTSSPSFTCAMLSGGIAGTSVDVALFPLDTIKTRLQAPKGFLASGGFRGVYNGIGAAAGGSAPGAAIFFCTYEAVKAVCIALPARGSRDVIACVGSWRRRRGSATGQCSTCLRPCLGKRWRVSFACPPTMSERGCLPSC